MLSKRMGKAVWYVETFFYDNGKVKVKEPKQARIASSTEDSCKRTVMDSYDHYVDFFNSKARAMKYVEEAVRVENAEIIR